jgi:hypothetical protein
LNCELLGYRRLDRSAASDLEHEFPRMVTDLRSFEITSRRGERMTARARGRLGQRARFAFLGGLRLPGMRLLDPVLRPAVRPLALRPIRQLERRLRSG